MQIVQAGQPGPSQAHAPEDGLQPGPSSFQVVGRAAAEEMISLRERVDPVVPGPLPTLQVDEAGWGEIDKLGAWECALSPFTALEEVPAQHREAWGLAMNKVHRKIWEAEGQGEEMDRALKWWFFLPQALLRQAQRGGRAGVGQIRKRFNSVINGDFGELVKLWEQDLLTIKRKEEKRRNRPKPEYDINKKARQAVSLISKGQVSKAVSRITSHGVASLDDPTAMQALKSKYPARGKEMPATVCKGVAVDTMKTLRDSWLALKTGVAPGTGQLRPEFLVTLAEVWEEGSTPWDMVDSFAMRHITGNLPPWYYRVCMTVETVGMFKTAAQNPAMVRPIGMRNPFIKSMHKEVVRQNKGVLTEFLEPEQLGMSVAGGAKLVNCVRMMLEENREFVCIKLDFRNAFNEVFRSRVVEALEEEASLRHLACHAATLLAPGSGLESRGALWGESWEGTTQGDPESGPYFSVAIHKYVRKVNDKLAAEGGCARFGWDDGYLLGPANIVLTALEDFSQEVEEMCGLVLQRCKTEVFTWDGILPAGTPPGLVRAGEDVEGHWEPGMICYGIPIGSDMYVKLKLDEKVAELEGDVQTVCEVLQDEHQSLWTILRSSISQKLDYWLTLVYPSQVQAAAERMDKLQMQVMERLVGMKIPLQGEGLGWDCPLWLPIDGLDGRSFQQWVLRQPVKMGGLGLRSYMETSLPAFIGGVEQSLPHFTGEAGVCPQLRGVLGVWTGENDRRWQQLLDSGCRTGRELANSWEALQREAMQCCAFLGQDIDGHLASQVESLGGESVDGSTRKAIVQQREELRGAVLKEALSRMANSSLKAVKAWSNRDKLSTSWLQCLPGPDGLSGQAFVEAMALALCMPSPACRDRIGAKVGRKTVDIFGDAVLSEVLPGDHWRTRHDKLKMAIHSLCVWARLPVTVEVWGLFSHLIPAQALTRMERGRKRQALVPDFRIEMPTPIGGTSPQLAELKIISCCETWYPTGSNTRATDRRARGLQQEYRLKAKKVDREVLEELQDQKGPVERRLDEFGELLGLCFGAWGEGSEGVHQLVQTIAEARLKFQGLQKGRPGSDQELGLLVGQVRRRLSLVAVKAQVDCLLAKLHQVGPGNAQLAKKRSWAIQEDQRMARERSAQWIRRVEGVHTLRKGFIKTA